MNYLFIILTAIYSYAWHEQLSTLFSIINYHHQLSRQSIYVFLYINPVSTSKYIVSISSYKHNRLVYGTLVYFINFSTLLLIKLCKPIFTYGLLKTFPYNSVLSCGIEWWSLEKPSHFFIAISLSRNGYPSYPFMHIRHNSQHPLNVLHHKTDFDLYLCTSKFFILKLYHYIVWIECICFCFCYSFCFFLFKVLIICGSFDSPEI